MGTLTNYGTITAEAAAGHNRLAFELNNLGSESRVNIHESASMGFSGGGGGEQHVIKMERCISVLLRRWMFRETVSPWQVERWKLGDIRPQSGLTFEHTGGTLDFSILSVKIIDLSNNDLTLTGGSLIGTPTFDITGSSNVFIGSGYAGGAPLPSPVRPLRAGQRDARIGRAGIRAVRYDQQRLGRPRGCDDRQ